MEFARKRRLPRTTFLQRGFLGYHPALRIGKGEWFYEENLSSHRFPLLSPRPVRRRLLQGGIMGLGKLNDLCYISQNTLYYGEHTLPLPLSPGEKQLLSFGAYLLIQPDMLWVNTIDHSWGSCEVARQLQTGVGVLWCDNRGEPLETVVDGVTPPENPNQYWLDTSCEPGELKAYSTDTNLWYPMGETYLRVIADGIGEDFTPGMEVLLEGSPELDRLLGGGLHEILHCQRDYMVFRGTMDGIRKELGLLSFAIRSPMPRMDFVIQQDNRLWGCRYGVNHNGTFVNEIYASKLGDFRNWYAFRGISSDSFVASLGEEGAFTGAATVGGYPVFFKENSLHKIYGSRPENFRIQSLSCVGVAPGCEKSIAHLGNGVIYEGRDGFYFYDGSMPVKLSQDLEGKTYEGGIGGVLDSVYYVTVQEEGQEKVLTYDSKNRLWHRENGNGAKEYIAVNGVLYYRREDGLYAIGTEGGEAAEAQVQWEGVSGILREEEPDQGSLVGLKLRLSMEPGSSVSFYGEYDSSGSWEALGLIQGYRLHSREIPLRIRPCDHLRLKVKGRGDVTIHSLTLTMENAM